MLTLYDLPEDLTNEFKSKTGEILSFVAINASVQLKDGRNAMKFAEEIREIQTPSDKTYFASSSHIIIAEMLNVMLRDSKIAVILTLCVISVVLFIDLRSVVDTLLVLTPLLTALIWIIGFMYAFNIKLNLYNMVAFPTVIGMGIDNGVHIFHRYKETGKGSLRLVLIYYRNCSFSHFFNDYGGFFGIDTCSPPGIDFDRYSFSNWFGMLFSHFRNYSPCTSSNKGKSQG